MARALFLFDFDQTLSAYDFRKRLPALAEATGVSQYRLASTWWAGGYESAAEAGAYTTTEDYLAAFNEVTGGRPLSRRQWIDARLAAMTPVPAVLDALRLAASLGTVSLLSNNPIIFRDSFAELAPEAAAVLGAHDAVSASLGARKPDREIYLRIAQQMAVPLEDAILLDDSAANVAGAEAAGMSGFQVRLAGPGANTHDLERVIREFAARVDSRSGVHG